MGSLEGCRALIVEDQSIVALSLHRQLSGFGCDVCGIASNADMAMHYFDTENPDVVIMDINLGEGMDGITLTELFTRKRPVPVVFLTAYSDDATLNAMLMTSAYGYIVKPCNSGTIKTTLLLALKRFELENEVKRHSAKLELVTDLAKINVLEIDETGVLTLDSIEQLMQSLGEGITIQWTDFKRLFPNMSPDQIEQRMNSEEVFTAPLRVKIKGEIVNEDKWFNLVLSQCTLDGSVVRIGAVQDITEQTVQLQNMMISDAILHEMNEGVLILDEHYQVKRFNTAATRLLNQQGSELLNKRIDDLLFNGRSKEKNTLKKDQRQYYRMEIKVKVNAGFIDCILSVTKLQKPAEDFAFVVILTDISKIKESERKLANIAFRDALTGVGNRKCLSCILRETEEKKKAVALIFLDLDSFKLINDNYGHDSGDRLIIEAAKRLKQIVRDTDSIVRFGGDEFVVVNVKDVGQCNVLAQRLLAEFQQPFVLGELVVNVTVSIGIAISDGTIAANELLRQADIAMYNAKKNGKNTYSIYHQDFKKAVEYRLYIEQGLRQAIQKEEIVPYFQPITDEQGRIVAFEALARWVSPATGLIPPDRFISVAEETNLIHKLGVSVFRQSCMALRTLEEMFHLGFLMHVNVSNVQLTRPSLIAHLVSICQQHRINPAAIVLEITESTMHNAAGQTLLNALKKYGFKIAVDDFGSGYSSLTELIDYNFHLVKLDKSLLPSSNDDRQRLGILGGVVSLFNSLKTPVLVEGVETQAQRQICMDLNCHLMQGYFFAKPMTLNDTALYLKNYLDNHSATNHSA